MLVNYANFVVMRIRRETDAQGNTISLTRLLVEISERPDVITRRRYLQMLALPEGSFLVRVCDEYFTGTWMRGRDAADPDDIIDRTIAIEDKDALDGAAARVQEVGNLSVAHRQRVDVDELRVPELDRAFDAFEELIPKYYALLHGSTLMQLEPTAQFDTLEAFTFPWIAPPVNPDDDDDR